MVQVTPRWASIALAFLSVLGQTNALAVPEPQSDPYPNLKAIIQTSPGTFEISPSTANTIKSELKAGIRAGPNINKRDSYTNISYCSDKYCTVCTDFNAEYTPRMCLDTPNTHCILVYDIENAHIDYWNTKGCYGQVTTWSACGEQNSRLYAPGTNSIGIEVGCRYGTGKS